MQGPEEPENLNLINMSKIEKLLASGWEYRDDVSEELLRLALDVYEVALDVVMTYDPDRDDRIPGMEPWNYSSGIINKYFNTHPDFDAVRIHDGIFTSPQLKTLQDIQNLRECKGHQEQMEVRRNLRRRFR